MMSVISPSAPPPFSFALSDSFAGSEESRKTGTDSRHDKQPDQYAAWGKAQTIGELARWGAAEPLGAEPRLSYIKKNKTIRLMPFITAIRLWC